MDILAGSATVWLYALAALLLSGVIIDAVIRRRRALQQRAELEKTVADLQNKLLAVERSLHAIGQRLLVDEKLIRDLKDQPAARPVVEPVLLNNEYPGQIAAWYEQESDRPESMTEAESLLQAMLKQRRVLARA